MIADASLKCRRGWPGAPTRLYVCVVQEGVVDRVPRAHRGKPHSGHRVSGESNFSHAKLGRFIELKLCFVNS